MAQYYVQVDAQNYIAKMAKALTDKDNPADWTQVTVATAKDIDFTNQFDKYYMDPQTHAVTKNHDTTTIGDVNEQLGQALDTLTKTQDIVKEANDTIEAQSNTIKQLQQMLTMQTMQQAKSDATIKQLQDLTTQLTEQIAKAGKAGD